MIKNTISVTLLITIIIFVIVIYFLLNWENLNFIF